MTDPQLPPPSGSVPSGFVPPAPPAAPPVVPAPPAAAPALAPAAYGASVPPVPPAPGYAAPPGAYQVPVGGYAAPTGAYTVPDPAPRPSKLTGTLSLVFALVAAVVTPIVAAFASYEVGRRVPEAIVRLNSDDLSSLAVLSPARDQVLWAEISFWAGTILGIAAIVLGIMAIARKRGRGQGIGALIVAVVGPAIFFLIAGVALGAGAAAGGIGLYS